jgi:hypothetical protein
VNYETENSKFQGDFVYKSPNLGTYIERYPEIGLICFDFPSLEISPFFGYRGEKPKTQLIRTARPNKLQPANSKLLVRGYNSSKQTPAQ